MYLVRYNGHTYLYLDLSDAIDDSKLHNGTLIILSR